ncbi:hypothetical protein FRC17_000506 [Serendipita sp. 399]|nr:hypothetical protein FRC17_000506 [Serendipita sp. 399]
MPPKELTKHQLSHRIQFESHTPNFLKAFQAKVSGFRQNHDEDEDDPRVVSGDEDGGYGGEDGGDGVKLDEFGREIRMGSEEREMRERKRERMGRGKAGDEGNSKGRGNGDEEEGEEAPVIVVLNERKHLSAREVENERRRARGLSPLPDEGPGDESATSGSTAKQKAGTTESSSATTSSNNPKKSNVQLGGRQVSGIGSKRKAVSIRNDDGEEVNVEREEGGRKRAKKDGKKKEKKAVKGLLSFGDDA